MNNNNPDHIPARGATLHVPEAKIFHHYGLLCPPDCRLPKEWDISIGGLPVPPGPATDEGLHLAILERRDRMTEAEQNQPENAVDNVGAWLARLHRERGEELAAYDRTRWGKPVRWNAAGRDK